MKGENSSVTEFEKILIVLVSLIGIAFFVVTLKQIYSDLKTESWQAVDAKVTFFESRCCWGDDGDVSYFHVRYQYEFGGELQTSDRVAESRTSINSQGEAEYRQLESRDFKVGDKVTAYIDDSGTRAVLERGVDSSAYIRLVAASIWFLLSLLGWFYLYNNSKQSK